MGSRSKQTFLKDIQVAIRLTAKTFRITDHHGKAKNIYIKRKEKKRKNKYHLTLVYLVIKLQVLERML